MPHPEVLCPECKKPMVLRKTFKHRYPCSGKPRQFYGCPDYPRCKGTHGAHPNGKPLGTPADEPTKKLRIKAHRSMDWWMERKGITSKSEAYGILKNHFGSEIHIGELDADECTELIAFFDNDH